MLASSTDIDEKPGGTFRPELRPDLSLEAIKMPKGQ